MFTTASLCLFVCQHDNFRTSKHMITKLRRRCIVQKSRPSLNLGVIAPWVRTPNVGEISAGCLDCEPKKTHQNVLSYLPQNPVHCDTVWYALSWINLRYSRLNVFQLTWIMSLHYLVKLSVAFCKWTAIGTVNPITHQMFLSHRLQNQANFDKILYLLSWIYLPQSVINVFHLT